eukprot:scaffold18648_cov124-Isochrysis_galbana.AAC.12
MAPSRMASARPSRCVMSCCSPISARPCRRGTSAEMRAMSSFTVEAPISPLHPSGDLPSSRTARSA